MTERTDILQRILNLRAKAVQGASEAEAIACIERADRMMHSYRVEEAELALAEASGQIKIEVVSKRAAPIESGKGGVNRRSNRHAAGECSSWIGRYTKCRVVFHRDGREASFIGDRPDAELAVFLQDMIKESMDRAYDDWRREYRAATGYGAKKVFQIAMARRINSRLAEMTIANTVEAQTQKEEAAKQLSVDPSVLEAMVVQEAMPELTSTALVMVVAEAAREREVESFFKRKYPSLGTIGGVSGGGKSPTAAAAGRAAGDRVHLGRAIGKSSFTAIGG